MTLVLTSEALAAAYDYLAVTEPFKRWNLPESDEVKFRVVRTAHHFAWYNRKNGAHIIAVSSGKVAQSATLLSTMAHEMVHLHLELTGMETKNGHENTHNAAFKRFAAEVCRVHGFDVKAFC